MSAHPNLNVVNMLLNLRIAADEVKQLETMLYSLPPNAQQVLAMCLLLQIGGDMMPLNTIITQMPFLKHLGESEIMDATTSLLDSGMLEVKDVSTSSTYAGRVAVRSLTFENILLAGRLKAISAKG